MYSANETIAAPATATGGAIAVIRVSGTDAFVVCDRIFRGNKSISETAGYTVLYGRIMDAERMVDDVLVTVFRAPHSYTGEDSVEISCHGSQYIASEILRLLICAGARTATPGEFTTRAFLAGKLDLAQAEAVADLIASSSRAAHAMAANQMRGGFSEALAKLRAKLLRLTSLLELELDFSEEDVEFADRSQLRGTMEDIGNELDKLRDSFALGNALKEGVPVAIVGAPNVGKSTLLNRLLNEDRAMVSEIAGTTRDVIEEQATIDGVRFRFIDTAGIRDTEDRLERMGIERTHSSIGRAQIILRMTEAGQFVNNGFIPDLDLHVRPDQRVLTIINKTDTNPSLALPSDVIGISAKHNEGIDKLRQALRACVDTQALYQGDTIISNNRHYEVLTAAHEALGRALESLENNLPADLLSEEIRQVIYHLGTITGQITTDEILGNIFSKFCIGK